MLDAHTSVGIALTVFYVPAVPATIYITAKNWHNRPRQAWSPLVSFALLRLAGGIIVICLGRNPTDEGLLIAAFVTLNVGLVPLIITTLGLIRIILPVLSYDIGNMKFATTFLRSLLALAIVLLSTGGGLAGSQSTASAGRAIGDAGYVVFACTIGVETTILLHLTRHKARLQETETLIYLQGAILSIPALAVRAVYGLLYQFNSSSAFSEWNPVYGSAVAFALMALLPEYIILLIYLFLGFRRIAQAPKADVSLRLESP